MKKDVINETMRLLNEEKNVSTNSTEDNEVYKALKELEKENYYNSVSKWSDSDINVTFYVDNSQEIYGSIDTINKKAKLTTSSGPNPLNPEFLSLLNKLASILQGYKMLHY